MMYVPLRRSCDGSPPSAWSHYPQLSHEPPGQVRHPPPPTISIAVNYCALSPGATWTWQAQTIARSMPIRRLWERTTLDPFQMELTVRARGCVLRFGAAVHAYYFLECAAATCVDAQCVLYLTMQASSYWWRVAWLYLHIVNTRNCSAVTDHVGVEDRMCVIWEKGVVS